MPAVVARQRATPPGRPKAGGAETGAAGTGGVAGAARLLLGAGMAKNAVAEGSDVSPAPVALSDRGTIWSMPVSSGLRSPIVRRGGFGGRLLGEKVCARGARGVADGGRTGVGTTGVGIGGRPGMTLLARLSRAIDSRSRSAMDFWASRVRGVRSTESREGGSPMS